MRTFEVHLAAIGEQAELSVSRRFMTSGKELAAPFREGVRPVCRGKEKEEAMIFARLKPQASSLLLYLKKTYALDEDDAVICAFKDLRQNFHHVLGL